MASLETVNPHSSSFVPKVYEAPEGASLKEQSLAKWKYYGEPFISLPSVASACPAVIG